MVSDHVHHLAVLLPARLMFTQCRRAEAQVADLRTGGLMNMQIKKRFVCVCGWVNRSLEDTWCGVSRRQRMISPTSAIGGSVTTFEAMMSWVRSLKAQDRSELIVSRTGDLLWVSLNERVLQKQRHHLGRRDVLWGP